jgi:SAM-dependent methyltransferase
MRLLNAGCGGQRDQSEHWWNLDNLRTQLKEGTPERINLDREERYIECNLLTDHLPFGDEAFDGILLQHVIEHFTCHEAVEVLGKLRRILKTGGLMVVTVPDAEYFLSVHGKDTKDRAVELFGEPIHDDGHESFFSYALFRHDHKQILTIASVYCLLMRAGFTYTSRLRQIDGVKWVGPLYKDGSQEAPLHFQVCPEIVKQLTRRKFSLEMCGVK